MVYRNQFEEACHGCHKPTHEACDGCDKPFCHGCLFQTGKTLTLPAHPGNEDYAECQTWNRQEECCLSCYIHVKKHPPLVLWQGSSAETMLFVFGLGLEKGGLTPAGDDMHSWYQPPHAGPMLKLRWGEKDIELDTFRTLQLLAFLTSNEQFIQKQAKATSDLLLPYERYMTEAAIRADLGIPHDDRYSEE